MDVLLLASVLMHRYSVWLPLHLTNRKVWICVGGCMHACVCVCMCGYHRMSSNRCWSFHQVQQTHFSPHDSINSFPPLYFYIHVLCMCAYPHILAHASTHMWDIHRFGLALCSKAWKPSGLSSLRTLSYQRATQLSVYYSLSVSTELFSRNRT